MSAIHTKPVCLQKGAERLPNAPQNGAGAPGNGAPAVPDALSIPSLEPQDGPGCSRAPPGQGPPPWRRGVYKCVPGPGSPVIYIYIYTGIYIYIYNRRTRSRHTFVDTSPPWGRTLSWGRPGAPWTILGLQGGNRKGIWDSRSSISGCSGSILGCIWESFGTFLETDGLGVDCTHSRTKVYFSRIGEFRFSYFSSTFPGVASGVRFCRVLSRFRMICSSTLGPFGHLWLPFSGELVTLGSRVEFW